VKAFTGAISEVVGLFVGSWLHAGAILLVIVAAYVLSTITPSAAVGFGFAVALAATVVVSAALEARSRR
jgi:hypothetical protein